MELKQYNTYIFRCKDYPNSVMKGKVLEKTSTTIQIENLDNGIIFRNELSKFRWEPIELIDDFNKRIEDTFQKLIKSPLVYNEMDIHQKLIRKRCLGSCFCDGSCKK